MCSPRGGGGVVLSAVAPAARLLRCTPDNQIAHESYPDSYRYAHTACHTTAGTIGWPPCLRCFQKHLVRVLPSLQLTWGGLACQPSEVIIRLTQKSICLGARPPACLSVCLSAIAETQTQAKAAVEQHSPSCLTKRRQAVMDIYERGLEVPSTRPPV